MKLDWRIICYIFPLFIGWRLALLFVNYFTVSTIPTSLLSFGGVVEWPNFDMEFWQRLGTNWDAGHFRGIAENGYLPIQTVFLPAFPLLIKFLITLGVPSLWGSLLIAHIATLIALYYLYKIIKLDFSDKITRNVIFLFLIFPTSFYLGTAYSEALFLAFALPSFYFARKKSWFAAFLLAGLATSTRLVGLALVIAIIVEYLTNDLTQIKLSDISQAVINKLKPIGFFYILLSLLPLYLYVLYQKLMFNAPLSFLTNEQGWGRHASFPWEAPLNYLSLLKNSGLQIGTVANTLTELLFFIFLLIGLIFCYRKLRGSYTIYYFLTFIIPLLSGSLVAIPRYALVIFPLFILLGTIKNDLYQKILMIFSLLLLGVFSALHINGYWIT